MEDIVSFTDVSFHFQDEEKRVLHDLTFALKQGTFNILVGPGGSGKSTLCRVLDGRIPHLIEGKLEGRVVLNGHDSAQSDMKTISGAVGSVFQDPESMFATLTVEDEIAFGPENLLFERNEIAQNVEELLELTDIKQYRNNLVWNLSGGQIQKLGLAAVLAMKPKIIILDEPTANLDPAATYQVHRLILTLREQGITILLVTRELDEFMARADHVFVLNEGTMCCDGTPKDVIKAHGAEMEELGIWLPETVEIGLALEARGCRQPSIPITVDETVDMLKSSGLLKQRTVLEGLSDKAAHDGAEVLIKGEDIRYSYDRKHQVLKGIDLEIRAGEMLAIVGRNGAGKSTMSKLLIGLNVCTEGKLELFGRPSKKWKVPDLANHISLVFQNPEHQFLTDTVEDEIRYSLHSRGVFNEKELAEKSDKLLEMMNLSHVKKLHPFSLSAGNKRRLGVATMLVGSPEVLIVDEPTYGQDKEMTRTLMKIMKDIQKSGVAVVMISHDMRLVTEYADRVLVFSEGRKYFDGLPTELFNKSDILDRSSLKPTLLFQILKALENEGIASRGSIPNTDVFVDLLLSSKEAC